MANRIHPLPDVVPDRDALKRIGDRTRARLKADDSVYRVPSDRAEIYMVGDFLSPKECEGLIRQIDAVAKPSATYSNNYADAFRTSYSGNVDPKDPLVASIDRRIDDLLGMNPTQGEHIQGQRYLPGQQFKAHYDWFHPNDERCWPQERNRGGQRCYTAMAFLNDVEEGGNTDFTHLEIGVQPKQGVLLMWNNADESGLPSEETIHAGTPVIKGVKYIITKWYRVRKWC